METNVSVAPLSHSAASVLPTSRQDFDVNDCRALSTEAGVQILALGSFYKHSGTAGRVKTLIATRATQ